MNIVIPMAGEGKRFSDKGYIFPKPLIDVNGKPMIQRVVENLNFDLATYIFLVRRSHVEKYAGLTDLLHQISKGECIIHYVNSLTEGAACTTLLVKEFINNEEELLIANSDQIIEYEKDNFNNLKRITNVDGIIYTFNSMHPKWSFVKLDNLGFISEVAEKKPISNIATCGIYWFREGHQYVRHAENMIRKNKRVNNEFYIAPVFNEMIENGAAVIPFYVNKMYGLGTPEDLEAYLK